MELHSNLFSSVCKLPILSIKLKYPGFFTSFQFSSLHYVLFLWKYNSFMGIYAFKRKKKLKKHCVYNHGNSCLFCFTYTYKYANYTSFRRFRWRQKCLLWFLRCLPFGPPFLFWLSEFFSFASEFSFQCFTEGKI